MSGEHGDPASGAAGNRLKSSPSPYLLQHAGNPVDWYPWGDEAFARARREDKPIFLSVGYSTCHWCHVMAHESFADPGVARLLNEAFVAIKVDREERPDIDGIYMTVCQLLTGHGGWPLTIVMTPDQQPFFAGTYFPKESGFGRIGLLDLIPRLRDIWANRREEACRSAVEITAAVARLAPRGTGEALTEEVLHAAFAQFADAFDDGHGGFGTAPKFPTPTNLRFLLRYGTRFGDRRAVAMVEATLHAMRRGGIFDQLGFGLHRYATDREWLVPHFEKMLYDQALLAMACTEAYQVTGDEAHRRTAEEIFAYVGRDLAAPEGGFYSAEDADSEGEEGKFYLWRAAELRAVLGPADAARFAARYHVTEEGNFRDEAGGRPTGANILHLADDPYGPAAAAFEPARAKLLAARARRVRPQLDDKVLTDWNGLMIAALAMAGRAFGAPGHIAAAARAARFVLARLRAADGVGRQRLLHRYRAGDAGIAANLDDYAFFIHGLIQLYQADFAAPWLAAALALNRELIDRFWDHAGGGGFFFNAGDGERLIVRRLTVDDGAVPSGNALAMVNLLLLARLAGDRELAARAAAVGRVFTPQVRRVPMAFPQVLVAVDLATAPGHEVVVAGRPGAADTAALLRAVAERFLPHAVVLFRPDEGGGELPPIAALAGFTAAQTAVDGRATAYVCRGGACAAPTTDRERMLASLG